VQILLAPAIVNYIKLVINTSTIVADPPDFVGRARELHPSIIALWHGQFFLLPGIYPREIPGRAIVARHDDAEALARVLRHFGLGLVRGAGAAGRRGGRDRGGAEAAHGLIASLREGFSVALTADVPPGPARKSGPGIVMISSRSGRPIVPFAVASSRYWSANSWSRMTINFPFSKLGIVMGDPIYVPREARAWSSGPNLAPTHPSTIVTGFHNMRPARARVGSRSLADIVQHQRHQVLVRS